ncbi:MAG: bifunctional riboflavin kinase/FAD synthetase [Myxococcota bacterium]
MGSAAVDRRFRRPIVTIGNFDGIHLGHRAILNTVVARAKDLGGEAVVYTFDPHPRKVLRPESAPGLLTTLDQKIELLAEAGVDAVVVEPFTREFASTEAEDFIRTCLHERLDPVEVYVGYDFHFGRDREGSMRLLTELGPRLGFAVTIIPEVTVDEGDVNSTRIRQLLAEGDPERAARMLGRPFTIRGEVVRGDERGRGIGFPTANLAPENEVLPAPGVYGGHARMLDEGDPARGARFPIVTNVGRRPTFDGEEVRAEAHLIDWSGDLYGRRIEISFAFRLRPERKFDGVKALKEQIGKDVAEARRRLEEV